MSRAAARANRLGGRPGRGPFPDHDHHATSQFGAMTAATLTRGQVDFHGVSKLYAGSNVAALRDVSFSAKPGEFIVIVGPSGCGKSTLLSLAAGLMPLDGGSIMVDGRFVRSPGPDRSMVFQEHGLFPWLTAAQNVEFGLKMTGMPAAQRRERVLKALDMVKLSHTHDFLIHQMSGGMRQRISIARALVMDPAVLLMDEPFSALDAQTRTVLHKQVQEIHVETRKTVLFVTHSVGEAVRLADRIVVMHANPGRIRTEITVDLARPRLFDSPEVAGMTALVRAEIELEVNRLNAEMAKK